jgi:hypothetical protein
MALGSTEKRIAGDWARAGADTSNQQFGGIYDYSMGGAGRAGNVWNTNQDWGLGQLHSIYDDLAANPGGGGGIPGYKGQFDKYKDFWSGIGDTGWASPEQKEAGWGWGNFKNFAETGGWSPEEMADFRARAASGTPQLYDQMMQEMQRGRTVQGGYGPGYGTSMAAAARDKAEQIRQAQLGAETSLADSIRQGKMWGSEQGAGAAKGELGQMETGQKEAMSIDEKIRQINAQAAASRYASSQANLAQRLGLINNITGLAGRTGGDLSYLGAATGAAGGQAGANLGYLGSYGQTQQKGPSFWDKLIGGVGSAAGAAAGLGWQPFGK